MNHLSLQTLINALLYEAAMWLIRHRPSLSSSAWLKLLLAHCRPDWEAWKTASTMRKVDEQAAALVKQWDKEEKESKANKLAEKAKELFPQATITPLPDAIVPAVMIVHEAPPEASDEIKALGAELRITWQLPE
jgi:hypothetical protein